MPKVFISEEICIEARDKLRTLLNAKDERGVNIQHRAAESLLRACQAQERYGLKPEGEKEFKHHAKITGTAAKALEEMTPDELLEHQVQMLGVDYSGRKV